MTTAMEETFEFKTEIQDLLHLIVHTLYTNKEIFLRELISNASDALSKVQFESLTQDDLYDKEQALEIRLSLDKDAGTLTIEDTGVGMSREELIKQIGTIAHSGTKQFMKKVKEAQAEPGKMPELIGQFGVGFYSVFMVADQVVIETRSRYREDQAIRWESDGVSSYRLGESERGTRGTAITLHLKEEFKEYLEDFKLENLVKQYSNYVPFPIMFGEKRLNAADALWRRSKSELKKEDYDAFYKEISNYDWQAPMLHDHLSADAPVQFSSVIFVPNSAPSEYYGQELEYGLKLYVKRVFIQDQCKQLVPKFLRFLRGVVESEDLPLNVGRETIQNDANITKIKNVISKKFLDMLAKLADSDDEKYLAFWKQYSRYIKEGVHSEYSLRDKLMPLLRFYSTKQSEKPTVTLKTYVENKIEGQKAIYYAVGENLDNLRRSPHLELFLRHGIEVLLATEPMDDFVFGSLHTHEEMKFINVESGELELPENLKKEVEEVEVDESLTKLKEKVCEVLSDHVKEVRFSKAMTDSPCRFFNSEGGMSHNVRKLMQNMNKDGGIPLKRDLELNPEHPFVRALSGRLENESIGDQIRLLYHMACLLEGDVERPQELAGLILPLLR